MTRQKTSRFVLIFALLVSLQVSSAWDPFHIFESAEKTASRCAENMMSDAKAAFTSAMNTVLTDYLPSLISKVDGAMSGIANEVEADIEESVKHIRDSINDMIQKAAETAIRLSGKMMEEIENEVFKVFDHIQSVEERFFQDVDRILDKISRIIKDVDCSIEGVSGSWIAKIRAFADDGLFPNPFDACRKEQHLGRKRVSSLDNYSLYKLYKCRIMQKFTEETSITDVLGYLAEGQRTAAQWRCMARMSPKSTQFYTREFVEWGVLYDSWDPDHVENSPSPILLSNDLSDHSPKVLSSNVLSWWDGSTDKNPCKDMFDCLTQSMQALEKAKLDYRIAISTVKDKASSADVDAMKKFLDIDADLKQVRLWNFERTSFVSVSGEENLVVSHGSSSSNEVVWSSDRVQKEFAKLSDVFDPSANGLWDASKSTLLKIGEKGDLMTVDKEGRLLWSSKQNLSVSCSMHKSEPSLGKGASLHYLDKQRMLCPDGKTLSTVEFLRQGQNDIYIRYRCCGTILGQPSTI